MHISWLGQTCIRLQTRFNDEDVITIIDPYRPETGEFPRSLAPSIALLSSGEKDSITLSQNPFVLSTLGECEKKEVMITAFPSLNGNLIFKINAEQISVVHLGRLNKKPDISELEKIGTIDILIIPVGDNKQYLNAEDAASIVTALEPRIVIPMAYQCDTDKDVKPLGDFIKESGMKPASTEKKLIIKKKDLPQDETRLIVLEKNV
ncbi:MAG: MBL fold metallo-hydrolase [Candidatus Magasanikbacteria bacterium]